MQLLSIVQLLSDKWSNETKKLKGLLFLHDIRYTQYVHSFGVKTESWNNWSLEQFRLKDCKVHTAGGRDKLKGICRETNNRDTIKNLIYIMAVFRCQL